MDCKHELDAIIEKWDLLKHPFYQAWSMGTLPVDALRTYAREYGLFIQTLPQGWQTLGEDETGREEQEHAELWGHFAAGLNAEAGPAEIKETRLLVQEASDLFASPSAALGALYAFEIQQPATAKSKLDGLRKWYNVPETGMQYFAVHAANSHESEMILTQINALPSDEQQQALAACSRMSQALWNALSGIYNKASAN